GGDGPLAAHRGPAGWLAQGPPGAQAGGQLPPQRATALDIQRLIYRLVGNPHRPIIGVIQQQPPRDLLRAPPPLPAELGLNVVAQPVVAGQLARLGPRRPPLGMPLRRRSAIEPPAPAAGGVAVHLPRHRRGCSPDPASYLTHPVPLRPQHRDLLPLAKRQVPPRGLGKINRRHPASISEPAIRG